MSPEAVHHTLRFAMAIEPLAIGVCSWSLRVKNIPELKGFLDRLGIDVVQIACGDPHHASWDEGDTLPAAARAAGFRMSGAMLGFPGEDYTTPQTIEKTGGFGDPQTRPERLERFRWGLQRTKELGLTDKQAGDIDALATQHRKEMIKTGADLKIKQMELADLIGENAKDADIKAKAKEAFQLRQKMHDARLDHMLSVRRMLSEEQQAKLKAMKGKLRGHRGMMMDCKGDAGCCPK